MFPDARYDHLTIIKTHIFQINSHFIETFLLEYVLLKGNLYQYFLYFKICTERQIIFT